MNTQHYEWSQLLKVSSMRHTDRFVARSPRRIPKSSLGNHLRTNRFSFIRRKWRYRWPRRRALCVTCVFSVMDRSGLCICAWREKEPTCTDCVDEPYRQDKLGSLTSVSEYVAYQASDEAWRVVFGYVREHRPSAAHLLCLLSFFDAAGIPIFVVRAYSKRLTVETTRCTWIQRRSLERDIRTLRKRSLVRQTTDGSALELNPSLQSHIQAWLRSTQDLERWMQKYLELIANVFPTGEFENWETCEQLLPHIAPIYEVSLGNTQSNVSWSRITTNVAWYFWQKGDLERAESNIHLAINIRAELFGVGDRRTLCSMEILASILMSHGNHVEAEQLHRRVLGKLQEMLPAHHPQVLTSMSNLALALLRQHKLWESERLTLQTLRYSKRSPRTSNIEMLTTLNNLALVLHAQGRCKQAEACSRRALRGFQVTCRRQHPNVLTSMTNLAAICGDQGKVTEAEELLHKSLTWKREQLGTNHPSTVTSELNLAALQRLRRGSKNTCARDQHQVERWVAKLRTKTQISSVSAKSSPTCSKI